MDPETKRSICILFNSSASCQYLFSSEMKLIKDYQLQAKIIVKLKMRFKGMPIKEPVCIYKKVTNKTVSKVTSSIEDETERNDNHIRNIFLDAVDSEKDVLNQIVQMETQLSDHLNHSPLRDISMSTEKHESVLITQSQPSRCNVLSSKTNKGLSKNVGVQPVSPGTIADPTNCQQMEYKQPIPQEVVVGLDNASVSIFHPSDNSDHEITFSKRCISNVNEPNKQLLVDTFNFAAKKSKLSIDTIMFTT